MTTDAARKIFLPLQKNWGGHQLAPQERNFPPFRPTTQMRAGTTPSRRGGRTLVQIYSYAICCQCFQNIQRATVILRGILFIYWYSVLEIACSIESFSATERIEVKRLKHDRFLLGLFQVSSEQEGNYTLIILLSTSETQSISFEIYVREYPFNSGAVIGVTLAVLVLILIAFAILVCSIRSKPKNPNGKCSR